jgi:hypothetical protein
MIVTIVMMIEAGVTEIQAQLVPMQAVEQTVRDSESQTDVDVDVEQHQDR